MLTVTTATITTTISNSMSGSNNNDDNGNTTSNDNRSVNATTSHERDPGSHASSSLFDPDGGSGQSPTEPLGLRAVYSNAPCRRPLTCNGIGGISLLIRLAFL